MPKVNKAWEQSSKELALRRAVKDWLAYPEQRESRTVALLESLCEASGSSVNRRRDLIAEVARQIAVGEDGG